MKLFVVAAVLGVCAAGRLDNTYLPPGSRGSGGSGFGGNFGSAAGGSGFKSAGSFGSGSFGGAGSGQGGHSGGFGQGAGGHSGGFGQGAGGHSGGFGQSAGGQAGGFSRGNGAGFGQSGSGGFGQHGGAGFGQGGAGQGFQTQHAGNIYNAPNQYQSTRQQNSADANAQILRSNSEVTADGFAFDFETSNGIRADASGVATNGVQSHGSFGYKGDDGQDYSITYTADENGYQPQGAHLPTPPPIPEAILKSLEQNARDEAAGISDDGSYNGEGAGSGYSGQSYSGAGQYSGGQQPSNQYGAPSGGFQSPKSNFGAASRQYLAPKAGPNGSGNFNSRTGYQY
ncbi:uncharacterized protein [Choristoneura fumiferana]|uniref:uncharacterized protein n=1 Tax=Choristoneura fumiferana TaxID=7141 RepID=UPI003D158DBB